MPHLIDPDRGKDPGKCGWNEQDPAAPCVVFRLQRKFTLSDRLLSMAKTVLACRARRKAPRCQLYISPLCNRLLLALEASDAVEFEEC